MIFLMAFRVAEYPGQGQEQGSPPGGVHAGCGGGVAQPQARPGRSPRVLHRPGAAVRA